MPSSYSILTSIILLHASPQTTAKNAQMCEELTTCHECAGAFVKEYIDEDSSTATVEDWTSSYEYSAIIKSDSSAAAAMKQLRQRRQQVKKNSNSSNDAYQKNHNLKCKWNTRANACSNLYDSSADLDEIFFLKYVDECPLVPEYPYPNDDEESSSSSSSLPNILPNWMGYLREHTDADAFGTLTYFDLSIPGTHDAITYDLSLVISDGALDDNNDLSKFLHDISGGKSDKVPHDLSDVIRWYSKTQQLTVLQQLDSGVRFIDFRIMAQRDPAVWMNLHFLQSKHAAQHPLRQIRSWVDAHPTEIVTIWLSRHGATHDTGQDQYPDVTLQQKHEFWDMYTAIFDGVMINATETDLGETPLSAMIDRDHRVVTFAADYVQFTRSSVHALDSRRLDNTLLPGVEDVEFTQYLQRDMYRKNEYLRAYARARGHFILLSLASSAEEEQILNGIRKQFGMRDANETGCALSFHIPEMEDWCPDFCLDTSQLQSYYNQAPMEDAHTYSSWGFPNIIYLDAVDVDGTIRTGTQLMFGHRRSDNLEEYLIERYPFVDTLLAYNVGVACGSLAQGNRTRCDETLVLLEERRSRYPMTLWDETKYGRHKDWP